MRAHSLRNQRGFSLLELFIAMLLTAIFMAIGMFATKHFRDRAMLGSLLEDIRTVKEAAQRFEIQIGVFPPDVARDIDPGLAALDGWQHGGHSADWEGLDLADWQGPYMRNWPRNPWGGLYDWDNYPSSFPAWGIPGGGVYLTLKPATWGGQDGMPSQDFEAILEEMGLDKASEKGVIAIWVGRDTPVGAGK